MKRHEARIVNENLMKISTRKMYYLTSNGSDTYIVARHIDFSGTRAGLVFVDSPSQTRCF